MRARLHSMSAGPLITPIRRCPRPSRCSVAAMPPAQLVAPTLGMSGGGALAGSTTTSGIAALRSCTELLVGQPGGDQDHAAGVVAGHGGGPARRAGAAVPDRRHGDPRLVRGAPLLHAAQDLHRPRAVQAGQHEVDEARPGAAAAALAARSCTRRAAAPPGRGSRPRRPGGRSRPSRPWAARRLPPRRSRRALSCARAACCCHRAACPTPPAAAAARFRPPEAAQAHLPT